MKLVELYNLKSGLKSTLPSDTLWGNLCWAIKYLYGDEELREFLNSYVNGNPQLIVSSTFPFLKKSVETIYFFPRPILPLRPFDEIQVNIESKSLSDKLKDMAQRKDHKNILLIEQSLFEKIINGEADYEDECFKQTVNYPAIISNSIIRNTINRLQGGTLEINGTGQLFTEDEYYIQYNAPDTKGTETGLYFLVVDHTQGKLQAALRLLSHIGIGGNRSIGKGVFEFRITDLQIRQPPNANALLNLSLYLPENNELKKYLSKPFLLNYQLEQRTGYYGHLVRGKYKKKAVTYFKEGSVFPLINQNVYGKNLIENHGGPYPLHRPGIALMIKMFINEQKYRKP